MNIPEIPFCGCPCGQLAPIPLVLKDTPNSDGWRVVKQGANFWLFCPLHAKSLPHLTGNSRQRRRALRNFHRKFYADLAIALAHLGWRYEGNNVFYMDRLPDAYPAS